MVAKSFAQSSRESDLGAVASLADPGLAEAGPEVSDALSELASLVSGDLLRCNRTIVERMDSSVALIPRLAQHLVAAGGKRIRPLLTLASARMCGYPPRDSPSGARHVRLAACVEFIHTATLLHDDVVDESALRRGLASANAVFGNQAPILVGDFLFARAFQIMVGDGSHAVLAILSDAAATIAEGEVLQLATQNDLATSEARYLEVVHGKTAALFAAACQVGAVLAGRPAAEERALREYGRNLGMAFQLTDDALDYAAEQAALGKTVGDDFREGKVTLPVLLAFASGDAAERGFWRRAIEEGVQAENDFATARTLVQRRGAIAATLARAAKFTEAAQLALGVFPPSALRAGLAAVADFAVHRQR
ncbi:MAG: polyprenyl synthetase family protein [Acetobacteraceae bacterium]